MRTALSLTLLLAAPATAQQVPAEPTAHQRAIAAGYKASMICSGMYNAGRTIAQIEAVELKGIHPEYDAIVPTLSVDTTSKGFNGMVAVSYATDMPPRIARWGWGSGCVLSPIGRPETPLPDIQFRIVPEAFRTRFRPDPRPWPAGDSGIAPPSITAIDRTIAKAFDGTSYGVGSTSVATVVVRDGHIVGERYADGFGPFVSNRTWSVAKSIAGTLAGVAALDPAQPARIANWNRRGDPRAAITVDNLLRMASGLGSDTAGNRTDALYFGGTAVDEQAPAWPLIAKPGTRFRYANNDTLLAMMALYADRKDRDDQPRSALFEPLGMRHTVAEKDWRGNYILSSQVWSTARDLARLGQFWLDDGVWQGKRILPVGWMTYMTTPSGPQPERGPGYGATLWLFGSQQGLPAGSYAAQGNRGQYVMVIPSRRLVIVRRGEDPGGARFDIARFAADIAAATAR